MRSLITTAALYVAYKLLRKIVKEPMYFLLILAFLLLTGTLYV